jgi:hypothetical protein|tara:strand:- start:211 stop:345 length:135 start_codon:yes stop_codon:yes gene_type:complete
MHHFTLRQDLMAEHAWSAMRSWRGSKMMHFEFIDFQLALLQDSE